MEDDYKAKLAEEICSISKLFVSCTHKIRRYPHKPAFVDWYLILQIREDSGIDEIGKRYRKLALQLHPDKNKHSSATAAFRLVSEAYKCLIDEGTRKAFDAERCYNICTNCINKTSPMKPNMAKTNRRTHGDETDMKRTRMGNQHSKASRYDYPIFKPSENSDSSSRDINQIKIIRNQLFKKRNRMRQSDYPIFEIR